MPSSPFHQHVVSGRLFHPYISQPSPHSLSASCTSTWITGSYFSSDYLAPLSSQSQRQLHLSMEAHGRYIARLMEQEGIAPRGDSPPDGGVLSTAAMAAAAATPAGGRAAGASPIPALELGGGRIGSGGGGGDGGMGPMAHLQFFANDDGGSLAGSPRGLDSRPRPPTYRGDGAGLPRGSGGDGPGALSGLGTGGIFEPHDHDPDHDLDGALAMFIGRVSSDYEILPSEDAHMHVPHQHHGGGGSGHGEQLQHQCSGEGNVHTLQQQQLMHPPHGGGGGGGGLQSVQVPPLPALHQQQQLMHHHSNGGGGRGSGGDLLATAGASPDLEQILFDSEGGSGLTNSSSQGGKRARQLE